MSDATDPGTDGGDTADAWVALGAAPALSPEFLAEVRAVASTKAPAPAGARPVDAVADEFEALFRSLADMDDLPAARPLVHGVLELDSLARLVGASNTGKSFVALSIAVAVARGEAWFGHKVERGLVIYMAAEGARGLAKRTKAIRQDQKFTEESNLLVLPEAVQMIGDDLRWQGFVEVCKRKAPVLIVIDTQARVTVGVDENSNTELGKVVAAADALRTATGGCVLLVHHTPHNADRARGAGAVTAAMDSEFLLEEVSVDGTCITTVGDPYGNDAAAAGGDSRVKGMRFKATKQKDMEFGAPRVFRLESVPLEGLEDAMGFPVTSAVVREVDAGGGAAGTARTGSEDRVDEIVTILDKWEVPISSQRKSLEALRVRMEAGGESAPKFRTRDFQDAVTRRNERHKYEQEHGVAVS